MNCIMIHRDTPRLLLNPHPKGRVAGSNPAWDAIFINELWIFNLNFTYNVIFWCLRGCLKIIFIKKHN